MAGVRKGPQSRQGSRWINRLVGPATVAAVVLVPPVAFRTYPAPSSPGLAGGGVLTPDAGDSYTYSSSTGAMDAAALPSNSSGQSAHRVLAHSCIRNPEREDLRDVGSGVHLASAARRRAACERSTRRRGTGRDGDQERLGRSDVDLQCARLELKMEACLSSDRGGSISSPRSGNRAAWEPSCRGGSARECTERTSTSKSGGSPPPSPIGEIRFTGVPSRSREPRRQTGSPAGTSDISPPVPPPRSPGWARGHGPTLVLRPPRCHRLLSSRDRSTAVDRPPPW